MPTPEEEQRWMAQWRSAERELAELRRHALRQMTDEEARRTSETVLSLANTIPVPPTRLTGSGLVAQQAIFHRKRA